MYNYNNEPVVMYSDNQMVPNVLMDEPQPMHGMEIQQGALPINGNMPASMDVQQIQQQQEQNANMMPLYGTEAIKPPFEIPDAIQRRTLTTKLFTVLLLQNIIMLPIMEIFLLCTDEPLSMELYVGVWIVTLGIFTLFYYFSEARRYAPMNILSLTVVTFLLAMLDGIYATQIGSRIAFLSKLVIIVQIIFLIIYIKQQKFRITNINAILLITLVFVGYVGMLAFIADNEFYALTAGSVLHVIYYVYDTQLIMSGHHGYNMQPEEFIFAATNIYADLPNCFWRFFRYIFLDHFIRLYKFFDKCCAADVC